MARKQPDEFTARDGLVGFAWYEPEQWEILRTISADREGGL